MINALYFELTEIKVNSKCNALYHRNNNIQTRQYIMLTHRHVKYYIQF